jgi:hypothetical protein
MNPEETRRKAIEDDRRLQADPELNLSGGRARGSQVLWIGIAVVAVVVLLIFGLTRNGAEDNVAATPQTTPATGTGSNPSGAQAPSGQTQSQGGAADQNTGAGSTATQRSSDVDAISGGSMRNPGAGKVAPSGNQ